MRRKAGQLIPIELAILRAGRLLAQSGTPRFHGFQLAKEMRSQGFTRGLTAHGTLYRALDRMTEAGLLEREWEDAEVAAREERPRRRYYWLKRAE